MPAAAVASRTPGITGISGISVGARGETADDIGAPYRGKLEAPRPISIGRPRLQHPLMKALRHGCPAHLSGPGTMSKYSSPLPKSIYFLAGAILESLAASGLAGSAGFAAGSAGLSMRSTLAASRSLAT